MLRSLCRLAAIPVFSIFSFNCSTTSLKNPATAKVDAPMHILMVGDSMMGGFFGKALAEELTTNPNVTILRDYTISTGLSGLHPYNWKKRTEELMNENPPDVLIVFFGGNDTLAVREPDGKEFLYHNSEFRNRYVRHVTDYLAYFAPKVKRLFMIGQPTTADPQFSVRYPKINDMQNEACLKFPNTYFVPSWQHTTINGVYARYMKDKDGKNRKMKYDDDVHPTPAGGIIMKDALMPYFTAELNLPDSTEHSSVTADTQTSQLSQADQSNQPGSSSLTR